MIPNAGSCTRLLTPSFSLYRFVVSRTSGAEYICPLSSRTARLTKAGPAQAATVTDNRDPIDVSAARPARPATPMFPMLTFATKKFSTRGATGLRQKEDAASPFVRAILIELSESRQRLVAFEPPAAAAAVVYKDPYRDYRDRHWQAVHGEFLARASRRGTMVAPPPLPGPSLARPSREPGPTGSVSPDKSCDHQPRPMSSLRPAGRLRV